MDTRTHVYIYIYIYTHTHTHAYTQVVLDYVKKLADSRPRVAQKDIGVIVPYVKQVCMYACMYVCMYDQTLLKTSFVCFCEQNNIHIHRYIHTHTHKQAEKVRMLLRAKQYNEVDVGSTEKFQGQVC